MIYLCFDGNLGREYKWCVSLDAGAGYRVSLFEKQFNAEYYDFFSKEEQDNISYI